LCWILASLECEPMDSGKQAISRMINAKALIAA
jgi:hypothetical protein